jgi:phosphoglycerate dehydrogenase-like enzyme
MSSNTINVLFINEVSKRVRDYLANNLVDYRNINFIYPSDFSHQTLLEIVHDANVLIGWRPTKELLEKAENLKIFINPGAGVKHLIDLFRDITKNKDVVLINGHGNSYFVAQHAVALLLALMNKIIPHHFWMKQGRWRTGDSEAASIPLRFRKIGLLGYGAINQKVHKMLSGFDVSFHILKNSWQVYTETNITSFKRYGPSQLREFCNEIDTLIIALPHTSLTENMISKEELRLLGEGNKKGLVVNVARGKIIEEKALYNSLKNNLIAGAAIDVWYLYKPTEDSRGHKYPYNYPFHELDNIILSPHRGYSPFDDLLRWDEVIENLKILLKGEKNFINVVNLRLEY